MVATPILEEPSLPVSSLTCEFKLATIPRHSFSLSRYRYHIGKTEFATSANVSTADNSTWPILKIGGGNDAGDVYNALAGTGWAFLGPRAASIGVGGFLLGGGIAFQTNKYGIAVDNLVGLEVVLIDGTIIYASPYNEHSDFFWACTGAGWIGIGVVTHFYIQA